MSILQMSKLRHKETSNLPNGTQLVRVLSMDSNLRFHHLKLHTVPYGEGVEGMLKSRWLDYPDICI